MYFHVHFFTNNLWFFFYMAAEKELNWFICLFGNVHKSLRLDGTVSKSTNRTVIVMTAKPLALLTLMNASEENGIADAADKASKLLRTQCDRMYDGMTMPRRFEFICILGPIFDYSLARSITNEWIKSRGGFPRATCAQNLAIRYNIEFNVNIEAIYALSDLNVDVEILEKDVRGTKLKILPKTKQK